MTEIPIEILVIDDSETARKSLENLLLENGKNIVHCFASPQEALEFLRANKAPDVVVVDIMMPEMNGYEFIKAVQQIGEIPAIVVSSLYSKEDKAKTMRAFEVGAIAIFEKPVGVDAKAEALKKELLRTVHAIYEQKSTPSGESPATVSTKKSHYKLIAMGASLGGPTAVKFILEHLPISFSVPIVIVQHTEEGFDEGLAKWLNETSKNKVEIARENAKPMAGTVYIAPYGKHLVMSKSGSFGLSDAPPVNGLKPSIDIFFISLAESLKEDSVAILLTGMGTDGSKGLLTLKNVGSHTIAQHQTGCEMYGMPKAAVAIGAAESVIPLSDLPKELLRLAKE